MHNILSIIARLNCIFREGLCGVTLAFTAGLLLSPLAAQAANTNFQNYFFDVCTNPTAALAQRCAETDGGLGNLSATVSLR